MDKINDNMSGMNLKAKWDELLTIKTKNNSKIIEAIEKEKGDNIHNIFIKNANENRLDDFIDNIQDDTGNIINNPLEVADFNNTGSAAPVINDLVSLLFNCGLVSFVCTYFCFSLLILFTVKLITEKNINMEKINSLRPLWAGKILNYVITKLISTWKVNTNLWIYIIIIFLLIFNSVICLGIYVCLDILS